MTNIIKHLPDLRRREKGLWKIAVPLWFIGPTLFLTASSYCQGSDIIASYRQENHYAAQVKGRDVTFSASNYTKAVPLEAFSGACWLGFAGLCGYSELLKYRIRQAENWIAYNRMEIPADASHR